MKKVKSPRHKAIAILQEIDQLLFNFVEDSRDYLEQLFPLMEEIDMGDDVMTNLQELRQIVIKSYKKIEQIEEVNEIY